MRNETSVTTLESTITRCLRWRSTMVPNTIEKTATSSMYAPPMMPVARMDWVSMYTQNVSANHRKLVVMFAIAVLTSTCTKVRMPWGGGCTCVADVVLRSPDCVGAGVDAPDRSSGEVIPREYPVPPTRG